MRVECRGCTPSALQRYAAAILEPMGLNRRRRLTAMPFEVAYWHLADIAMGVAHVSF